MLRPPETFSTARLAARPPCAGDAPAALAAYAGDPVCTRFLSWRPYRESEALADFFRQRRADWAAPDAGHFMWMLCLRDTDTPIGTIGCQPKDGKVVFGYVLGQPHWGRGLASEALSHLVDWTLAQPEVQRAWAFCDVENPVSARVMEKAGMTREGVLRRWHTCPTIGPGLRDCIVCAKVK